MSTLLLAAQASEMWGGVNHWAIGAGVLALLVIALGILVAFGGGREHS
jgi:hypothetical protein